MKRWINLFILFCLCGNVAVLQAQNIDVNDQGIQAKLRVKCYVDNKEVTISGRSLLFSARQANKDASLKVYLDALNPDNLGNLTVKCKEAKDVRDISIGGFDYFFPNINTNGGRWTLIISSNNKILKEHILEYSISPKPNTNEDLTISPIDSEEASWEEIKDATSSEVFKKFLKKYPKSKYSKLAKNKIFRLTPLSAKIMNIDENQYTIQVSPVLGTTLSAKLDSDSLKTDIKKISATDLSYEIKFELEDSKKYTLSILDPGRANGFNSFDLIIDNTFQIETIQEDGLRKIKLTGGKSPYQAQFFANNSLVKALPITENPWAISATKLATELPPGKYKIKVRDAHMIDTVYYDLDPLVIPVQKIGIQWQEWTPYLLAAFALIAILIGWSYSRKNKQQKRIETAKAQMKQNLEEPIPQPEASTAAETESTSSAITITKEPSPVATEPDPDPVVTASSTVLNTEETTGNNARKGFVIKAKSNGVDEQLGESEYFQNIIASGKYCIIPLNTTWANSAIKSLYFNPLSVKTLDEFLWAENINLVRTKGANIPEIGGMLLGRCAFDAADETYVVAIERFVPIQARFHNVYQLAFDPISIATEVSKITDENPDYRIMGWFHTHPGHGLFLSQQDLEIQEHYRELYHFAMEIDSLSDNLDTAFFTRTKDGVINNHKNLIKEASWFSWNDIKNHHLSI